MNLIVVILLLLASIYIGGVIVTILHKKENKKLIKVLLALSGGFLLSIAFVHFIPELYHDHDLNAGLFILLGFMIQLFLEFFSGGIEHGHVHHHKNQAFPYGILIALSIHSLIEGIPLGHQLNGGILVTSHHHGNDSMSLLLGILLHQVPVAIALTTLLKSSNCSVSKLWVSLSVFAITTPIGTLFGYYGGSIFTGIDFNLLLAIVVGMFLHISTTIIFETSENHKFNLLKLSAIICGGLLAFLMH